MKPSTESMIRETVNASNQRRIHFGEVVGNLLQAGVESYTVDYRSGRSTYFMPCGETLTINSDEADIQIAQEFSEISIKQAILGAQRGEVKYPEFKKLSQDAGCIGYTVWISGKHVTYFGRNGDMHVEPFPNS